MNSDLADLLPWLTGAAAFGMIASVWLGVVLLWSKSRAEAAKRVQDRLGLSGAESDLSGNDDLWQNDDSSKRMTASARNRMGKLARRVRELGWDIPPSFLILGPAVASVGVLFFVYIFAGDWLVASGAGLLALVGPWLYINNLAKKRRELFDTQLALSLGLAARSLRAGHPLAGSFRLIVEEMDDPISSVFDEILQQQNLGVGIEDALRSTAESSSSDDLVLVAASIIIQSRSGGNLADTMHRLEEVIRDRMRLMRKTKSLTAQAQLSKKVLIAIPFLTMAGLQIMDPDYMRPIFTTNTGRVLLAVAGLMLVVGSLVMDKLSTLKY